MKKLFRLLLCSIVLSTSYHSQAQTGPGVKIGARKLIVGSYNRLTEEWLYSPERPVKYTEFVISTTHVENITSRTSFRIIELYREEDNREQFSATWKCSGKDGREYYITYLHIKSISSVSLHFTSLEYESLIFVLDPLTYEKVYL
jgi:hypothetical protein